MSNAGADSDPLLRPLIGAPGSEREQRIADILASRARPIVAAMLRSPFAATLPAEELADIESEVMLKLIERLDRFAHDPSAAAIADFASYTRAVIHHAIEDRRRKLLPSHRRLANRLRYLLLRDKTLAIWDYAGSVCGLAAWKGRPPIRSTARVFEALPSHFLAASSGTASMAPSAANVLRDLVHAALAAAQGPIAFAQLVAIIARVLPDPDDAILFDGPPELADDDAPERLDARDDLDRIWAEILLLPVRQRAALLLHLRLDDGESLVRELPALGLASIRRIADVLEIPIEKFVELWNALPLDDLRIAALMGLTRQQVINLRKSARERLARRMRSE